MRPTDRDPRRETQHDIHRPKGNPRPREAKSQKAQLQSEEWHGELKEARGSAARLAVERPESSVRSNRKTDLQVRVQRLLDEDRNLRSYDLNADVTMDGIARITGVVDTLSEKRYAAELVSAVQGISQVENSISISTDGRITDTGVEMEVAEEIALDDRVRTIPAIQVERGRVTLTGTVSSEEERLAMIEAASRARGVTDISDNLRIDYGSVDWDDPESILHSQVRNDGEREARY